MTLEFTFFGWMVPFRFHSFFKTLTIDPAYAPSELRARSCVCLCRYFVLRSFLFFKIKRRACFVPCCPDETTLSRDPNSFGVICVVFLLCSCCILTFKMFFYHFTAAKRSTIVAIDVANLSRKKQEKREDSLISS